MPDDAKRILLKYRDKHAGMQMETGGNTTIAVIATDAVLTKAAAKRLAMAAHDGFVRAIWPTHTPADGDLVFALATGGSGMQLEADAAIDLYAAAGATMARAISSGVFAAVPAEKDLFPVWSSRAE
jgi:L-aminopeptidase/D-esterase-like protein